MEVNSKGRTIHKGPRGGEYVLEKGKKIYKFTRARVSPVRKLNSSGRVIHKGPRGGEYVLEKGKKIYTFKKVRIYPAGGGKLNSKGRTIHKGPRGGEYVLENGKKIYKFKRGPSPVRVLPSPRPSPVRVPKRVGNKLLKLLTNVRKRKIYPNIANFNTNREIFTVTRFLTVNPDEPIKTKDQSFYVDVPSGNSELTKLIKNDTVMGISKDTLPLQSWLDAQSRYLKSLNNYDLFTAMSYTVRSHQWIGPWLRGNKRSVKFTRPSEKIFTKPLYSQVMKLANEFKYRNERWAKTLLSLPESKRYKDFDIVFDYLPRTVFDEAMELYVKDLQRIIRGAPPVPRTMYLYRGLYTNIFDGKLGTVHKFDEFASGAYYPQKVYAGNSYIRMKILKGTRVLLLQGLNNWSLNDTGEFEVLINKGARYIIRKRYLDRYTYNVNSPMNWYTRQRPVTDITVY